MRFFTRLQQSTEKRIFRNEAYFGQKNPDGLHQDF